MGIARNANIEFVTQDFLYFSKSMILVLARISITVKRQYEQGNSSTG